MSVEGTSASIPSEVRDLIEFFDKELRDVRFPDIDRGRLVELAAAVSECTEELSRMQEQTRAARDALDRALAELRRGAERGLAYARVYADGNDALTAALDELTFGHEPEGKKPMPRVRGRGKGSKSKAGAAKGDDSASAKPTLPFAGATITEAA